MTKNEAKSSIEAIANKEGRKIAISELPKTFVVEGQEVVCSDGRFRSDDRHFWPHGVKPAAEDKTTTAATTKKRTTNGTTKRATKAAAVKILHQRVIVGRLLKSDFCTASTKAAAVELANKRKQAQRVESAMNQYNEQLKAKATAKAAKAAKKQAAETFRAESVDSKAEQLVNMGVFDTVEAAKAHLLNQAAKAAKQAETSQTNESDTAAKVESITAAKPAKGRARKSA